MQLTIDIEKEFDAVVPVVGGQRVSELLGDAPDIANADYLFDGEGVIAELKCLQDNKLNDKKLNDKIMELFCSWQKQGIDVHLTHDDWRASLSNLPPKCSQQVLEVYAKAISKRVIKANKQIRQTREALGRPDHQGLLLLANDGNFALDPQHVRHILAWIMRTAFSSIDTVVFFTVNMPGRATFINLDTLVWANLHRQESGGVNDEFLQRLADAWIQHVERVFGAEVAKVRLKGAEDLARITNLNPG